MPHQFCRAILASCLIASLQVEERLYSLAWQRSMDQLVHKCWLEKSHGEVDYVLVQQVVSSVTKIWVVLGVG